jgi:FkbM family methyltransferase
MLAAPMTLRDRLLRVVHALGRVLARHRRNPLVSLFGRGCKVAWLAYENSNYDFRTNGESRVLARLRGQPFTTLLDVGANVGDWARDAAGVFPEARIHCFEVIPATFARLRENTRDNPNVRIHDFGLSDRAQELEFKHYPGAPGLTSMFDFPHTAEAERVRGRVEAGDAFLLDQGIAAVDFLKIDVEGAELLVLEGLRGSLARGAIQVVQFEYGLMNVLTRHLLRDFYALLGGCGYRIGKVYPTYVDFRDYRLADEDFLGPNYLAVRAERGDLVRLLG